MKIETRGRTTRLMLAAILSTSALTGAAQAGTLVGTVTDGSGTRALQGAQVDIVELGRSAEASADGSFRFPDVPAGTYTLRGRYSDAKDVSETVTVADDGTVKANLVLGDAGDYILVVGQRANLASSISRQRAADGVESVLTRDGIGQFPDQNVAESIRRLSGVNILNDQGEGRFVAVRGLSPDLNAASINGTRIPAPGGDVRSVALDVVPAELIESIEIKKTLTPDMDADTIGASIEINTTSAFDRKKDLYSVKLEGSYNDYADALTPKASFDFSTRLSDRFGIAGGFSYYKRKFESDNIEAADWRDNDGAVYAEEIQYRDYDVERKRIGATLSMDWLASDTTKLYARGLYSQFDDQEYRGDVILLTGDATLTGNNGTTVSFSDEGESRIEVRRRMKDRLEKQRIKSLTVGGETNSGPWKLTYSGSWSESRENQDGSVDPTRFRARFEDDGVGLTFDYSDPRKPRFTPTGNVAAFLDPENYEFNELEHTVAAASKDREFALRGDVARTFAADGGTFTVQSGVKARWRKKSFNLDSNVYDGYDGDYTLADVLGGQTYRIQDLLPLPSHTGPTKFFNDNLGNFELNGEDTLINSTVEDYRVREDLLSAYVLGRWDSEALRVIGGLRMERTKNDIRNALINVDTEVVTPQRFERSYTDWLPSLSLRYEPARDMVLRFGGSKSLVRPKLSNLAQGFQINEDREAELGNPALRPYSAWNLDASAEWYFASNAALTGGVFWKSIKDFIVDQRTTTPGTINGIDYTELATFVNGDTAKVKGVELSYSQAFSFLPAPFDGLLFNANYTYTDAKGTVFTEGDITDPRKIPLLNSSKHTFNLVLGYEKGPISLRAAGTYRDKYLDELGDEAEQDRYVSDHFQLDLSAKYRITPSIRVFAEWINVTDAPYFAYQNFGGSRRLLQYEEYNWTAKFGVTASF